MSDRLEGIPEGIPTPQGITPAEALSTDIYFQLISPESIDLAVTKWNQSMTLCPEWNDRQRLRYVLQLVALDAIAEVEIRWVPA